MRWFASGRSGSPHYNTTRQTSRSGRNRTPPAWQHTEFVLTYHETDSRIANMEAARPLKRKLSASTMATHGSEGDYDRGHQKSPRPPFRPDPLPFDATAFAGISRGPGGYNNDPPHSTSSFSMRPHALSPSNREEAEEVQKKIQQAKGKAGRHLMVKYCLT